MMLDNGVNVSGNDVISAGHYTVISLIGRVSMGWARWAWIAIPLLAFAPGNATAADMKRVLLLHSFGANFQAEDTFAGYLRTIWLRNRLIP